MSQVREVDPLASDDWDRFVRSHPNATVYHLAAWSRILAAAYRFRPRYLELRGDDGEIEGVLPLAGRRGLLTGRRLRSLPAIEIGGPLARDRSGEAQLLAAAGDLAARQGAKLSVDSGHSLPLEGSGLREVRRPPTWIAPIPAPEGYDEWLSARSSNLRRGVKRAAKHGVTVRLAESELDLRRFYRLYLETMRKHRAAPRSWRQLELSRRLLGPETFRLFLAEYSGKTIAGGVFHDFGGGLELLYNGSDETALDQRPNHALYSSVVRWGAENGRDRLDYGFAWPDTNLGKFKRQWGGEAVARFRYETGEATASEAPPEEGEGEALPEEGERTQARWLSATSDLWGKAPLGVTRLVAVLAYRYL